MKLHFVDIKIEGFRSFAKPITVSLDQAPGLYLISGDNQLEPELGGNGVGKSSLMEALFWVFYGRMTNGLTAANVSTWGSDHAKVSVCFELDGMAHMLYRSRGPNRLQLDGKEITDEDVVKLIKIPRTLASSTFLIGQFAETFLEEKQAGRLELFSQLLSEERWELCRDRADQETKTLEADLSKATTSLAVMQGRLREIDLDSLQHQSDAWTDSNWQEQQKLQELVKQAEADVVRAKETLAEEAYRVALNETAGGSPQPALPETPSSQSVSINPEIADLESAILQDEKLLSTLQFGQRIEQSALDKVSALGPVCKECGQAVDESFRAEHVSGHEKVLEKGQIEMKRLTGFITKNKFKLRTLKAEQERKETEVAETAAILRKDDLAKYQAEVSRWRLAQNALTEAVGKRRTAEFQVSAKQATLKKLLQDQERLKQAVNPFISLLADAGKKQAEYATKIEELEQTCIGLRGTIADFAYWKDGFRRIRILAVQQALKQLEIAINDGLVQLGLRGWSILLDAERELTNGSIKREFVINVQSPYNQELVPWESFSGGERQRLRMAFLFGLQSFMTQRTGVEPSLLFVDEPTTWLSEGGIGDMLNFLAMKAKRDNLQVWLADHRTLDFGDFAGHLVVVKTAEGSHIEKGT